MVKTVAEAGVAIVGDDRTDAAWRSAIGKADSAGKKMANVFKVAFAGGSVGAIASVIGKSIEFGDELGKAAAKSGIATRAFSELAHAAKMSDIDMSSLSTSLSHMQRALSEASTGSKSVLTALSAIGLELKDLQALSPDRQFEVIGDAISRLKDPADRTRAAMEIFGKAGADLLPLFEKGAAGIRAARQAAVQLGKSLGEEQVKRLQDADDAIKRLSASTSALGDAFAIKLAPGITAAFDELRLFLGAASDLEKLQMELDRLNDPQNKAGQGSAAARRREEIEALIKAEEKIASGPRHGGPGSRFNTAEGFAAADAAAKAEEEAEKERKKKQKEWEEEQVRFAEAFRNMQLEGIRDVDKLAKETSDRRFDEMRNLGEMQEERNEKEIETQRAIDEMNKQMQAERAAEFQEVWGGAFNTWVNSGKRTAREFGKALLAEIANKKLMELIGALFGGGGTGSTGFVGGLFKGIGKIFGFASGGSFTIPGSGNTDSVVPIFRATPGERVTVSRKGGGSGASIVFAPVFQTTIAGDATERTLAAMRRRDEELKDDVKADMIEVLERNGYAIIS